ncbi:hypothetical protein LJC47_03355 [Desulfosarcina sp. OttesenSCG-928-B08]|nr:hypothetical protein [Desulfosarcina sp. OttesenSCG-928-B08]
MMWVYLKIAGLVVLLGAMAGFILPALFSAKSTPIVLLGLAMVIILPVAVFLSGKNILKSISRLRKGS